jgi:hypothetical protein
MHKPLLAFLTLLIASGSAPADSPDITAQSLPAITEPSWSFSDNGSVYLVGKQSGRVTIIRSADPQPEPEKPRPKPPPVPDQITGVKWFSVIVDPSNPEQAAWRTSTDLRKAVEAKGIEFRTYASIEQDIDTLGFRQMLTTSGTPCVILQDGGGKMLKVISPKTLDDLTKIVEAIK